MPAAGSHDHVSDGTFTDAALESEIELVSELVVAATSSEGPLPQAVVDRILGIASENPQPPQPDS